MAFSRAGEPKTYVQHLVAENAGRVGDLIDAGAVIFVCGDGSKMEPDVKRTLVGVRMARTGADETAAKAWIEELGAANRYVLDVWAGS